MNAGERRKTAQEVVNDVLFHMNAWNYVHYKDNVVAKFATTPRWREPPDGFYKINCDGTFLPGTCKGGWGFVIRDNTGQVMAAGAGATEFLMNAQHAEAVACFEGIKHATRMGLDKIIVELDAATVVDAIRNSECDRSPLAMLFREIRIRLMYDFSITSVSHCPRACNAVAHTLAAIGLKCDSNPLIWHEYVPEFVSVLVSRELPGRSK